MWPRCYIRKNPKAKKCNAVAYFPFFSNSEIETIYLAEAAF